MNITWTINNLERQASDGLVIVVHWGALAVDGDYSSSIINTQTLERGESFVSYDSLTEEIVLNWLWNKVDKNVVESSLASQIDAQKNPVKLNGLPW
jgi:hypothetical protein